MRQTGHAAIAERRVRIAMRTTRLLLTASAATAVFAAPAAARPVSDEAAVSTPDALPSIDARAFATTSLTLPGGIHGKVISFKTRNPAHFREWFAGDPGGHATLSAQLFVGEGRTGAPLIVMVPGSANIGPHHLDQVALLASEGFAVLLIDPLHGRSIQSTAGDQAQLSWAASVFDILAGIDAVAGDPAVDTGRIGLLGSSRGGFAVVTAMMSQITERFLPSGTRIVAGFAGYPWCGLQFWQPRIAGDSALRIFSGDRDDWVSIQQCQDLAHSLAQRNKSVQLKLLHGAGHAFDRAGVPPTLLPDIPRTTQFPTVYMDDDGNFLDPATGEIDDRLTEADFLEQVVKGGFVERGVTVGSEGDQANIYNSEMLGFFRDAFGTTPELKGLP